MAAIFSSFNGSEIETKAGWPVREKLGFEVFIAWQSSCLKVSSLHQIYAQLIETVTWRHVSDGTITDTV